MSDTLVNALRRAAPVGTTVTVYTVSPNRVRLCVPTGDFPDGNVITRRAADVLGEPYDNETDTIAGGVELVSRLSMALHGSTGSLFATVKPWGSDNA